ncbi:MAG: hypothetical protein MK052_05050 [Alphaproteobacteria bacterium]|nr:hypothetical protein [Alphaproteobacteria bacterium]
MTQAIHCRQNAQHYSSALNKYPMAAISPRKANEGFSLVEMTLVLMVLAFIAAAGLSVYDNNDSRTKIGITNARMDAIQEAFQSYRYSLYRLPCPADSRLTTSDVNYGMESLMPGICDDGTPQVPHKSGDTVTGAVPTRSLNIPDEYMYDGWGRKFTYTVDVRMTEAGAFLDYKADSTDAGNIQVDNSAATSITTSAIYALISHGSNGHGAYLVSGKRRNANSVNTAELENAGLDSGFADAYDNVIISQRMTENSSNYNDKFDDIVRFKERWAMLTAIDLLIADAVEGTAAPEPPPPSIEVTVAVSRDHSCVITSDGEVYCWGNNSNGQVGDGSTSDRPTPRLVTMPAGVTFTALFVNSERSCALGDDGKAYCWGENLDGQLGDGTTVRKTVPTALSMPAGVSFTQMALGFRHTCALGNNGTTYCWGYNLDGRLGDGTYASKSVPTAVSMPSGVAFTKLVTSEIAHICGIGDNGKLYCWGPNGSGQLGDGTSTTRNVPTATNGPAGVSIIDVAMSDSHTCAAGANGVAYCWGNGSGGELGDNTDNSHNNPATVVMPAGVSFANVYIDKDESCARSTTGLMYCWGENRDGQVGDGTLIERQRPTASIMPSGITFESAVITRFNQCAVGSDGNGYCWGLNENGEVGDDTLTRRKQPTPVVMPSGVSFTQISGNRQHFCAAGDDDKVYCWGFNDDGQIGNGGYSTAKIPKLASF